MNRDRTGSKNSNWRGGRMHVGGGRIALYTPGHPGATLGGRSKNYVYEYRLVAEKLVGRPLTKDEIVHHKNGDATDNRLCNLEVMTQAEHSREHAKGRRGKNGQFLPAAKVKEGNLWGGYVYKKCVNCKVRTTNPKYCCHKCYTTHRWRK